MGDHHHGHALAGEIHHDVEHLGDHFRIERGGRLVEQHRNRVHRQRPGNGDALLLAAGQFGRVFLGVLLQADAVEQLFGLCHRLLMRPAEHLFLCETQVLDDPQMRKQFKMLKHHADAGAQLRQIGLGVVDLDTVEDDFAALERLQRIDAFDQRRFSRPRGTAHHHHLALGHACGAILQRLEARPVPFVDMADLDHARFSYRTTLMRACRRRTPNEAVQEMTK